MTTLKDAHTTWKRRMTTFKKDLEQTKAAYTNDAVADVEYGEQQLRRIDLLWDKLEEAFTVFKHKHPEPDEPGL